MCFLSAYRCPDPPGCRNPTAPPSRLIARWQTATHRERTRPLREQTDVTIDTSHLAVADFKRSSPISSVFQGNGLTITVMKLFSFRRGLPARPILFLMSVPA